MCGIVGYSGKSDCVNFLMSGLKKLEYRGYDSAGIATIDHQANSLEVRKECGVLANLEDSLSHGIMRGTTGIGHTRWATHGKPTQENSHPHCDKNSDICIVHNGIIENHEELKKELSKDGIKFLSETDSECVPHLIAKYLKNSESLQQAFFKTISKLEGSFAIVMISKNAPDTIYATRQGSPLIAGFTDEEIFLASDSHPLFGHTKNLLYLEEGDILVSNGKKTTLFDIEHKEKKIKIVRHEDTDFSAEMDGYESYTLKEIHEQPSILRRIIKMRIGQDKCNLDVNFEKVKTTPKFLKSIERIYMTGCGTAAHAALIGKYYLEEFMDLPVEVILSSEFRYAKPKLSEKSLVIAVSQSGETADTLASIIEAKKHNASILSVVNVLNSSIDRESDATIYTHAGPEIGVASTKAFSSQVLTLLLLSIYIAKVRGEFKRENDTKLLDEMYQLPTKINKIIKKEKEISDIALKYHLATSALYLGRHLNYPIALEGALKNKEISYMHAEGYPAGEMKHGPIALIDKSLPVICICTESGIYEKMVSNVKEVEAREGIIISIATQGDKLIPQISREVIFVPKTAEELYPILNVVVLQIFAYYLAHFKGNEIDKPRNLAKSVTVE